ncbi:MAG: hypothetical protein U0838_05215 [Chloroflexota bacterium]
MPTIGSLAMKPIGAAERLKRAMTGLPHHVVDKPAVDLVARAIAIAVVAFLIFVGLPALAVLAAG